MTETFDIAMLGPSGAGKTSLLVSMYAQFRTMRARTGLNLVADDATTSIELNKYRTDLERISRQLVVREPGISGTRSIREHAFRLQVAEDKDQKVCLRFTDYPGGWLLDPHRAPQLSDDLNRSGVMVLAVDTPALLAEDGRWHHDVNAPQRIADIVSEWADRDQPRLLVIVPLKCEAWVEDDEQGEKLALTVRDRYAELIDGLRPRDHRPDVVIAPVLTVGSLVFDGYEIDGETPISRYRGRRPNGSYSPQWTAEPLRHVMSHVLEQQQARRSVFRRVADLAFGGGRELREGLGKLVDGDPLGPYLRVE